MEYWTRHDGRSGSGVTHSHRQELCMKVVVGEELHQASYELYPGYRKGKPVQDKACEGVRGRGLMRGPGSYFYCPGVQINTGICTWIGLGDPFRRRSAMDAQKSQTTLHHSPSEKKIIASITYHSKNIHGLPCCTQKHTEATKLKYMYTPSL